MIVAVHVHFNENERYEGYEREFIDTLDDAGVDKAVVFSIEENRANPQANLPAQPVTPINEEIARLVEKFPDRIIGTVYLHPLEPHPLEKMEHYVRDRGMKAVKVMPIGYYPDDSNVYPIYEKAVELDVPVIIHAAVYAYNGPAWRASKAKYIQPVLLDSVMRDIPELKLVISHCGNPLFQQVLLLRAFPNVFLEMSGLVTSRPKLAEAVFPYLFEAFGADRFLYGGANHNHKKTMKPALQKTSEFFDQMGLSEDDQRKIMGENAIRLFGLEGKKR